MAILKNNKKLIGVIVGTMIILIAILTLTQQFEYRASIGLLVIQKQTQNLDPYTAAKSSEILRKNLSSIIPTSSFFEKVLNSGFALENNFSSDPIKCRKQWRKKISIKPSLEDAILTIDVYDKNKEQAKEFANAIAYVLATQGYEYYGGDKNIEIKIVDAPIASRFPARPNILLNLLFGLILGFGAGIGIAMSTQHGTRNMEHETRNTQHGTRNMEHETRNTQHITHNMEHETQECVPNNIPFIKPETGEHVTQNAEHETRSTQHVTQNMEERVENKEEEKKEIQGSMDNLYK